MLEIIITRGGRSPEPIFPSTSATPLVPTLNDLLSSTGLATEGAEGARREGGCKLTVRSLYATATTMTTLVHKELVERFDTMMEAGVPIRSEVLVYLQQFQVDSTGKFIGLQLYDSILYSCDASATSDYADYEMLALPALCGPSPPPSPLTPPASPPPPTAPPATPPPS